MGSQGKTMSTKEYRWEVDEVSGPLLRQLLAAEDYSSWETRAFLRPIFRWMKLGLHKDGSREDAAIERAFAFVEWLVLLATRGDDARGIPRLPMLQPSYALNTIVTASQRAGSVREAQRAFDLLEVHGYQPDVFTYTALIDVIARNGDLPAAIKKYEEMRMSTSKPNVVTYTTLVRAVGLSDRVGAEQCLVFLDHAREDGGFDEALLLEALESCARRKDRAVATRVLNDIAAHAPKLRVDDRFFYTVGQVAKLLDYDGLEPVLAEWVESGVLGQEERVRVEKLQAEEGKSTAEGSKTLGCLGHQTSQSVRKAVVHHDINRLISRIQNGSLVTVNDFETLIHQCRKRKWKEDVSVIIDAMRDLATKGWQPSSRGDDSEGEAIPPQPQLQLTSKTRELPLYRKFVRGAYLLTNCDHIAELITLAHEDKVVFTQRMGVEIARMFGYRHKEGFKLLHAMQVLTTSRDKDSKNAAEQSIRDALMITPDPCLFLLQSVISLRFLDLTFRTLGKLAKQLLVVVTDELPMEERHALYCVSQLPLLSVHIVKELDDVVYLHRSHRSELLTFCLDALETDSIDKTMGFLMRRPELYDAETAAYLGPKFAEMFVYGGFQEHLQGNQEFKLEHEAEFMPYMMQARAAMPKPVYADASATPADDTAYLKIPLAQERIVVVDSDEALSMATDLLMRDSVTRLGLDAEWRPDSRAAVQSKCSILQVACNDYVFIFDFVEMALGDLEELFEHLFASERIAKIGFAIDGDIKRLRWSFPEVKCFDTFVNVLDFSFETLEPTTHLSDGSIVATRSTSDDAASERLQRRKRRQKGLSTYIKQALGFPLSKLQQKSDWERRPLTPQQVAYAALDAYCLLMLQDAVAGK
ncbi:putative exonuclease mut-7 [Phytophthora cinnamomi]|uniref:putative exonuclease mut-7 n=1 Tax=Phytophthora cinnamomi TaxID=4785 RepID=UPI003559E455|nr:putative exonuclease mut-7 [Phytophthora cinnamomi]